MHVLAAVIVRCSAADLLVVELAASFLFGAFCRDPEMAEASDMTTV